MSKRAVKVLISTVLLWAAASVSEHWTAQTAAAQASGVALAHAQSTPCGAH